MQYKQYDKETLKKLQEAELQVLLKIKEVCDEYDIGYSLMYGSLIGAARHNGFIPWDDDMDIIMLRDDYEKFIKIFNKVTDDNYTFYSPLTDKNYSSSIGRVMKNDTVFIPDCYRKSKFKFGVYVDVFVLDKVPNSKKKLKRQVFISRFLSMLLFLIGSPTPIIPNKGFIGGVEQVICCLVHYVFKLFPKSNVFFYKLFDNNAKKYSKEDTNLYTIFLDNEIYNNFMKLEDLLPYSKLPYEGIEVNVPKNYDKILTEKYGNYMQLPPEEKRINHAAYKVKV